MSLRLNNPLRVVLDTDTYNEVDDQFALAHLLLSSDRIQLDAVYAAPFFNNRSTSPADGMERSFDEIHRVIDLVNPAQRPAVFRGSTRWLSEATSPVHSDAASDLVTRAMAMPIDGEKLHVIAIAAATNIASALLIEPRIASRIVIVWLGGHAPSWPHTDEFNLKQDIHAARILLDHNVPLVLVPCSPVCSHVITTVAELEKHLAPHSRLGTYLTHVVRHYGGLSAGWSKVIWDIAATGYLIDPTWVRTVEAPSPVLQDNLTWLTPTPSGRRSIRIAQEVHRDGILIDFFAKAQAASTSQRSERSPAPSLSLTHV